MQTGKAELLKDKFHVASESHSEPARIRIHRAISWLARAEQEDADPDARFIFLWIAFNAACAKTFGLVENAQAQVVALLRRLLAINAQN